MLLRWMGKQMLGSPQGWKMDGWMNGGTGRWMRDHVEIESYGIVFEFLCTAGENLCGIKRCARER